MSEEQNTRKENSKEQITHSSKEDVSETPAPSFPGQIHALRQPQTSNLEPQTNNMEVHHHAHTSRKKWTHYFWEFFMLFLAVTLGFLVENQREHYVEHLRARQYAQSLADDLKADTLSFNNLIQNYHRYILKIDSFRNILKEKPISAIPGGSLYYYCKTAHDVLMLTFHDATLEQLKNSGNLRYFTLALQNRVSEYDRQTRILSGRQETEIYYARHIQEMMSEIFDAELIDSLRSVTDIENFKRKDIKLIKQDTLLLRKIVNEIINWRTIRQQRLKQTIEPTYAATVTLLLGIKKEYHLK